MHNTSSPLCQWLKNVESNRRKQVLHKMTKTLLELKLDEKGIKTAFKQLSSNCNIYLERCDSKDAMKLDRHDFKRNEKNRKTWKGKRGKRLEENIKMKNDNFLPNTSSSLRIESDVESLLKREEKAQRAIDDSCITGSSSSLKRKADVMSPEILKGKSSKIHNSSSTSRKKSGSMSHEGLKENSNLKLHNSSSSSTRKYDLERQEDRHMKKVYDNQNDSCSSSKRTNEDIPINGPEERRKLKRKFGVPYNSSKHKRDCSSFHELKTKAIPSPSIKNIEACRNEQTLNQNVKEAVEMASPNLQPTVIKIDPDDNEIPSPKTTKYFNVDDSLNMDSRETPAVKLLDNQEACDHKKSSSMCVKGQNENLLNKYPSKRLSDESVLNTYQETNSDLLCESPLSSAVESTFNLVKSEIEVRKKETVRPTGTIKVRDPASLGIKIPGAFMLENALKQNLPDITTEDHGTISISLHKPPSSVTSNVNTPTNSGQCNVTVGNNNNISIYLMGITDIIKNQLDSNQTQVGLPNQCSSNNSTDFNINSQSDANPSKDSSQTSSRMTGTMHMNKDSNSSILDKLTNSNRNSIPASDSINPNNSTVQSQSISFGEILTKEFDHTYTSQRTNNFGNAPKPSGPFGQTTLIACTPTNTSIASKQVPQTMIISKSHSNPHSYLDTHFRSKKISLDLRTSNLNESTSVPPHHAASASMRPKYSGNVPVQTKSVAPSNTNEKSQSFSNSILPHQLLDKSSTDIFRNSSLSNAPHYRNINFNKSILKLPQPNVLVGRNPSLNLSMYKSIGLDQNSCGPKGNITTDQINAISQPESLPTTSRNVTHQLTSFAFDSASPANSIDSQLLIASNSSSKKSDSTSLESITSMSVTTNSITTPWTSSKSNVTEWEKSIDLINQSNSNVDVDKPQNYRSADLLPDGMATEKTAEKHNLTNFHDYTSTINSALSKSLVNASTTKSSSVQEYSDGMLDELDFAKIRRMYSEVSELLANYAYKEEMIKELNSPQNVAFDISKYDKIVKHYNHQVNVRAQTFVSLLIMIMKKFELKNQIGNKMIFMIVYVKILEHFLESDFMKVYKKIKTLVNSLLEAYKGTADNVTNASYLSDMLLLIRLPEELFGLVIFKAAKTIDSPLQNVFNMHGDYLTKYSNYVQSCIQRLSLVEFVDRCSKYFSSKTTLDERNFNSASEPKKTIKLSVGDSPKYIPSAPEQSTKKLLEPPSNNSPIEITSSGSNEKPVELPCNTFPKEFVSAPGQPNKKPVGLSLQEKNISTTKFQKPRVGIKLINALPLKSSKNFIKTNSKCAGIQIIKRQIQLNHSLPAHSSKGSDPTPYRHTDNLRNISADNQSTSSNEDLLPIKELYNKNKKTSVTKPADSSDLYPIIVDVMSLQGVDSSSLGFDIVKEFAENFRESQSANHVIEQKTTNLNEPKSTSIIGQKTANLNEPQSTVSDKLNEHASKNIIGQETANYDELQPTNTIGQNLHKSQNLQSAISIKLNEHASENVIGQETANYDELQPINTIGQKEHKSKNLQSTISIKLNEHASKNIIGQETSNYDELQPTNTIGPNENKSKNVDGQETANLNEPGIMNCIQQNPANLHKHNSASIIPQKPVNPNKLDATSIIRQENVLDNPKVLNLLDKKSVNLDEGQISSIVFLNPRSLNTTQVSNEICLKSVKLNESQVPYMAVQNPGKFNEYPATNLPGPVHMASYQPSTISNANASQDVGSELENPSLRSALQLDWNKKLATPSILKGKREPDMCNAQKILQQYNTSEQPYLVSYVSESKSFLCARNGCTKKAVIQCSVCKTVRYCDVDCQKYHWLTTHKNECRPFSG